MKNNVSPVVAIGAILVIVALIAGFVFFRGGRPNPAASPATDTGMPPQVTQEIQKRLAIIAILAAILFPYSPRPVRRLARSAA